MNDMKRHFLSALAIAEIAARGFYPLVLIIAAGVSVGLFCWVFFNDGAVQ